MALSQAFVGNAPDPSEGILKSLGKQVEERLKGLYDEVYALLEEHREGVMKIAGELVERKTISGDDITRILEVEPGSRTIHKPVGYRAFQVEGNGEIRAGEPRAKSQDS
jgi:ATP-dependent Zn protease